MDAQLTLRLADRSDKHHPRVTTFMLRYKGRLLTTWPVLAETCHFLPEQTQIELLRWADAGGLGVADLHDSALAVLADWKAKYLDLAMDLADASLIWVARQTGILEILTIDLKDFSVYGLPNGKALKPVL